VPSHQPDEQSLAVGPAGGTIMVGPVREVTSRSRGGGVQRDPPGAAQQEGYTDALA
jgi:hypothetical protein